MYDPRVRASLVVSVFSLGIGASLALASGHALADEPSAADIASARRIGFEGIQLAEKGNCAAAIDKLARAEALRHAPTILGRLGECQIALGKLVVGTENLQTVLREPLPPSAPAAFRAARERAQKVLDATLPKLAKVRIAVKTPPGVTPKVLFDGDRVSDSALDLDRPADPGAHEVEVSAPGFVTVKRTLTLREGGSAVVALIAGLLYVNTISED